MFYFVYTNNKVLLSIKCSANTYCTKSSTNNLLITSYSLSHNINESHCKEPRKKYVDYSTFSASIFTKSPNLTVFFCAVPLGNSTT